MIPIALDPRACPLALVGVGAAFVRRLAQLRGAGAASLIVFSPDPAPDLVASAGETLFPRLPLPAEIADVAALWIVGLAEAEAAALAVAARALRVLVNVEDVPALCDFHNVAEIRRGDLLVTVSTGGRAPGLAAAIRRRLEGVIGAEWQTRLDDLAARRRNWRGEGRGMAEIAALTETAVAQAGWLA